MYQVLFFAGSPLCVYPGHMLALFGMVAVSGEFPAARRSFKLRLLPLGAMGIG